MFPLSQKMETIHHVTQDTIQIYKAVSVAFRDGAKIALWRDRIPTSCSSKTGRKQTAIRAAFGHKQILPFICLRSVSFTDI
jgi:hypothetical protein